MRLLSTLAIGASLLAATVAVAQQPAPTGPRDRVVTRAQALAMAERRFHAVDADGNGVLSSAEMSAAQTNRRHGKAMAAATREEALTRAGQRFDRLDTNRDGRLEPTERRVARQGRRRGGDRLARLLGPDGVVTRQEMVARATARFDRLDSNRDGKLERAELAARGARPRATPAR